MGCLKYDGLFSRSKRSVTFIFKPRKKATLTDLLVFHIIIETQAVSDIELVTISGIAFKLIDSVQLLISGF